MIAAEEFLFDESRQALQCMEIAVTDILAAPNRRLVDAYLTVARPELDSADMDDVKTLFPSELTFIWAPSLDVEPPCLVVSIAVSVLGMLELFFTASRSI